MGAPICGENDSRGARIVAGSRGGLSGVNKLMKHYRQMEKMMGKLGVAVAAIEPAATHRGHGRSHKVVVPACIAVGCRT